MPVYATTFDTPEPLRSFIQCVQGMATLVEMNETRVHITIESDDEYELANTVRELQDEMNALLGYNYVLIERPKLADVFGDRKDVPPTEHARGAKKAKANKCGVCGTSALKCEQGVFGKKAAACCAECGRTDTHDMSVEDWKAFRDENGEAIGLKPPTTQAIAAARSFSANISGALARGAQRAAPASPPKHRHRWDQPIGLPARRSCTVKGCNATQTQYEGVWK